MCVCVCALNTDGMIGHMSGKMSGWMIGYIELCIGWLYTHVHGWTDEWVDLIEWREVHVP